MSGIGPGDRWCAELAAGWVVQFRSCGCDLWCAVAARKSVYILVGLCGIYCITLLFAPTVSASHTREVRRVA
jgi:hypothetical protein